MLGSVYDPLKLNVKLCITNEGGSGMEAVRKLQKIGGSVALTIPAEMARELGLSAGDEVRVRVEDGRMVVERAGGRPPGDVVEFMARFMGKYDEALRNLAGR